MRLTGVEPAIVTLKKMIFYQLSYRRIKMAGYVGLEPTNPVINWFLLDRQATRPLYPVSRLAYFCC